MTSMYVKQHCFFTYYLHGLTTNVNRLWQTTLAKRTQDIPDLAVLGLTITAQGKESDPDKLQL